VNSTSPQKYSYPWFINRFKGAKNRAGKLYSVTNNDLLTRRPAPGKWSAAECLSHLVTFGNIYYNIISHGLQRADSRSMSPEEPFIPRFFWRIVIKIFEPPYKLKLKTIPSFKPPEKQHINAPKILDQFTKLQNCFSTQLKKGRDENIDLHSVKVGNPALPLIKMRLSECYAVAEAHQRRHLWQAEQTLRKINHT